MWTNTSSPEPSAGSRQPSAGRMKPSPVASSDFTTTPWRVSLRAGGLMARRVRVLGRARTPEPRSA